MSAATSVASNAESLPTFCARSYRGWVAAGAFSHFLTVFLDKPVFLEISLIETPSRIFMRLTLPIMSMVITSFAPAKKFSSRVIHPGQF